MNEIYVILFYFVLFIAMVLFKIVLSVIQAEQSRVEQGVAEQSRVEQGVIEENDGPKCPYCGTIGPLTSSGHCWGMRSTIFGIAG
jgi:hypothetical protein